VSSGSSPATASMKSILLGNFNTCAISATKACATRQSMSPIIPSRTR
jgi:hypothetical protein